MPFFCLDNMFLLYTISFLNYSWSESKVHTLNFEYFIIWSRLHAVLTRKKIRENTKYIWLNFAKVLPTIRTIFNRWVLHRFFSSLIVSVSNFFELVFRIIGGLHIVNIHMYTYTGSEVWSRPWDVTFPMKMLYNDIVDNWSYTCWHFFPYATLTPITVPFRQSSLFEIVFLEICICMNGRLRSFR